MLNGNMTLTKNDLQEIAKVVKTVAIDAVKTEIKPIKLDLSKLRKDVDTMLSMFDREYVDLRTRVERIEDHLNFPKN